MNNYPCKCGHAKSMHPGFLEDTIFCDTCWKAPDNIIAPDDMCEVFKADNLKYLEEQYVNHTK